MTALLASLLVLSLINTNPGIVLALTLIEISTGQLLNIVFSSLIFNDDRPFIVLAETKPIRTVMSGKTYTGRDFQEQQRASKHQLLLPEVSLRES